MWNGPDHAGYPNPDRDLINLPVVYFPFFRNFTAVLWDPVYIGGHQSHRFPLERDKKEYEKEFRFAGEDLGWILCFRKVESHSFSGVPNASQVHS